MTTDGGNVKSLEAVIGGLRTLSGEIDSCAVLSDSGRLLYSGHTGGVEFERVQAMLSALAGITRRIAQAEEKAGPSQVRVKTEAGHLLMVGLDDGGCIAATTGPEARIGLVLYDMRNARDEVSAAAKGQEIT